MPSLTIEEVQKYSQFQTYIFEATGTYMGDTVNTVKPFFEKVFSIELDGNYASRANERFKNDLNVFIVQGDSSTLLNPICKSLDKPTFFWLDGHWSGGDTGRGDKDCPLLEELIQIVENCNMKCVIAIDDVRLFDTHINEDWKGITRESVLKVVESRLESCKYYPSYLYSEDRMVLHLKGI